MLLGALIVFRVWFAAALPMTGDEAYFVLWGEHPAGGYYDHPPLVGWWLTGALSLSRAEWVLRLPALLLPLLLAGAVWALVRVYGVERARCAACLVLLAPANVWNVLITTDTPVILFTMCSALAYVVAERQRKRSASLVWHACAGALLGLAFLGKYFAALLGIAYLVHTLCARRDAHRWWGFVALLLAALPAPAYNLWWNSEHCWVNILFNFLNRHEDAGLSWRTPVLYLVSLVYLATPWLLFALWRNAARVRAALREQREARTVFWLAAVPLALFAAMSLVKTVGLHWLVSFIPLVIVLAAIVLPLASLHRLLKYSAVFAVAHILAIASIAALPTEVWKKNAHYDGIVLTVHADELLAQLQPYAANYVFATDGYSPAATLAYHAQRPFVVFGEGSFHARQDDFLTDWRDYDGRNLLILKKSAPVATDYAPYFAHVELREFRLHGVSYYLVLGQRFDYAAYHAQVLRRIKERFYRIPAWLPQRGCEFCERYFPAAR